MFAPTVNWIDDHINPIVVKELRQAVQSRFVVVILHLFLVVMLVAITVAAMMSTDMAVRPSDGRGLFNVLHGLLLATLLLFVPAYCGVRMAAERSDVNVDLLFTTTIRPRSIVTGKFLAGVILAVLIFSACTPFIAITYLFRGVDLPSILIVLGFDVVLVLSAIAASIFVACIRVNIVVRVILFLALLGALFAEFSSGVAFVGDMVYFGVASRFDTWDFWGPALSIATAFIIVLGGLMVSSAAMLTPPSANRALGPRLFFTIAWLVSALVAWLVAWLTEPQLMVVWTYFATIALAGFMFICVSERDTCGPRIRRHIPRAALLRALKFLFTSGWAGGMLWSMLMLSLTVVVSILIPFWTGSYWRPGTVFEPAYDTHWERVIIPQLTFILYAYCYCMTANLLRLALLRRWVPPMATGLMAAALMAVGSVVPSMLAFFLKEEPFQRLWLLGDPFAAFYLGSDGPPQWVNLTFTLIWAIAVTALCLPWFIGQLRNFKPLDAPRTLPQPVTAAVPEPITLVETP